MKLHGSNSALWNLNYYCYITIKIQLSQDEVDILRETSDKVVKYESTIETYKKKLEEMGDLKRQIKEIILVNPF